MEVVVFTTSVVASVKPAAVAAIVVAIISVVVAIVSVVNVPRNSGTTRISEYKTAASKSNRRTDCKITSEANSESAVAGAVLGASVALTADVATSLVLIAGVMNEPALVELAVVTAVAV